MKSKILVIDDDRDLCRLLKHNLEAESALVTLCHDGAEGIAEFGRAQYHLVVLDIMLPAQNGYEVLQEIRKKSNVPVLMLTARDSEGDKVSGLRMGADDYLTKPFSGSEFLARVFALLRRYRVFSVEDRQERQITADGLKIDAAKREVCKETYTKETGCNMQLVDLTATEFDLLYFLAKNRGQVFTKKQIYTAVWQEEYAYDDNTIMVHIRRLRKKIEENPEEPKYILTVWGVGYKFGGGI